MPAASTVLKDSQPADSSTRGSHDGNVPSGFILKLYQMVNGAPDDMITVSLLSRSMAFRFARMDLLESVCGTYAPFFFVMDYESDEEVG
jgi:hypothetical protein